MDHFLCRVERVKRFVKVDLHCIIRNLKGLRKMSPFSTWKIFCGHSCTGFGVFSQCELGTPDIVSVIGFSYRYFVE